MSKVRFVPDYNGYTALLNGSGVQALIQAKNSSVYSSAVRSGNSSSEWRTFSWTTKTGATGWGVGTSNYRSMLDQAKYSTLTTAVKSC